MVIETLQHGNYCDVTEEQAVELLKIEGDLTILAHGYAHGIFSASKDVKCLYNSYVGLVLSGYRNGDEMKQLEFADFKQMLINTVK